jgi:hypothetical protein
MHAHEVQPADNGTGAVLLDRETQVIEGAREIDPAGVVGPEPGREDDGAKAAELQPLRRAGGKRRRWGHLGRLYAPLGTALSDHPAEVGVAGVAKGHGLGEVGSEMSLEVINAEKVAQQVNAKSLQCAVVEVVTSLTATDLRVGAQPGQWAGKFGQGGLQEWRVKDPRYPVPAVEPAGYPGSASTREVHVPPRLEELLGQLAAGLPAPDHQRLSGWERFGRRVVLGVHDMERCR